MQAQASPDVAQPTPPAPPPPFTVGGPATAQAVHAAAKAQREVLGDQLERLEERREELSQRLREATLDETDRKGLQTQLTDVDARLTTVNQQITVADQRVAQTAGVPGAVPPDPPREVRNGPPEEVFIIPIVFTIFVLFPLAIAYARRIWRRSTGVTTQVVVPPELNERMARLEHAVESVAVEVERIGEGQRFVTKLFAESTDRPRVEAPR
jgi:hypothetical protein